MAESKIKMVATAVPSALGLPGACWAMNQIFPDSPAWLVNTVLIVSIGLLIFAAVVWFLPSKKPKKEIIEALEAAITQATQIANYNGTVVESFKTIVREWMTNVETLVRENTGDRNAMQFKTLYPMIDGNSDIDTYRMALLTRHEKLRKILDRYMSGENVER